MRILVDTNILLRIAQPGSPHHQDALAALDVLDQAGHELCLVRRSSMNTGCRRLDRSVSMGWRCRRKRRECRSMFFCRTIRSSTILSACLRSGLIWSQSMRCMGKWLTMLGMWLR